MAFFNHLAYVVGYTMLYIAKFTIGAIIIVGCCIGLYMLVSYLLNYLFKYNIDIDNRTHDIFLIAVIVLIGMIIGANIVKLLWKI